MSWWQGINWGSFNNTGALQNPDKGEQLTRPVSLRAAANVTVTDERAMMISTVFACVRILVQTGATLPIGFYTRTENGRESLDQDHFLCRLLKYKPNNFMTAKEFRQAMWTQRVLWGNGYAKIKWSAGRPVELTPLKPAFMTPIRETNGILYKYSTSKGVIEFDQKDIFHIKGFSADGVTGLSALGYARESLGLSIAADRSASKSIGGRANAVLEVDGFPTDEQKEKLRDLYGGESESAEYAADGQLMITVGGMKYRGISIPPDDLQLLESRQFQVPEICRFFGVPAVMVDGAAGAAAAWPASYEQQVLSFLTFTLKPYLEEWEDKVGVSLLDQSDQRKIIVEHKIDGLLRADSETRQKVQSGLVQNGLRTRNEMRKLDNYPPIKGGDELTVQVNLTGLDDLPKVNDGVNNVAK